MKGTVFSGKPFISWIVQFQISGWVLEFEAKTASQIERTEHKRENVTSTEKETIKQRH